jgi:hypothetical protein
LSVQADVATSDTAAVNTHSPPGIIQASPAVLTAQGLPLMSSPVPHVASAAVAPVPSSFPTHIASAAVTPVPSSFPTHIASAAVTPVPSSTPVHFAATAARPATGQETRQSPVNPGVTETLPSEVKVLAEVDKGSFWTVQPTDAQPPAGGRHSFSVQPSS